MGRRIVRSRAEDRILYQPCPCGVCAGVDLAVVGVNDLLNQNKAFARTVGSGYTQNAWNSVIGRYFTVQFNYNLRYFGKNASKNIDDYDGMGQKAFGGGRPPMHR